MFDERFMEGGLTIGVVCLVILMVCSLVFSIYDSHTGTASMTTGTVIDKEHEIRTDDGSTAHTYYFIVQAQDAQELRASVDEGTYRRERVGAVVILDVVTGGVSKQAVSISARSMQSAEETGVKNGL